MKLSELAARVGGEVQGDGEVDVRRVAPIEQAGPGDLSFVANRKYLAHAARTRASALIAAPGVAAPVPLLTLANPYLGFARAVALLHPQARPEPGVHATAQVDATAVLGADVHVGAYAVIGARVRVGARCVIHPHVVLYEGVELGDDCLLHSGAQVREGCQLGRRVIVQNGAVIGADAVLAGQVGIAGSTRVGHGVTLAGQVGVAGHITIGDGVVATAQTGIPNDVEAGACVSGYPAIPNRDWLKSSAVFARLPELQRRLRQLEAELERLKGAGRDPAAR